MKIKFYYPDYLYDKTQRNYTFELLKVKEKAESATSKPFIVNLAAHFEIVSEITDADLCILPMAWNYYFLAKRVDEAKEFIEKASSHNKTTLSSTVGDFGISLDLPQNCLVYRITGYRSKLKSNERIFPFYLSDPIQGWFNGDINSIITRPLNPKPVVGFCGMAPTSPLIWLKEKLKVGAKNLSGSLGLHPYDAQAVLSSSKLRVKSLESFYQQDAFTTNYILREKYRAGVKSKADRKKTGEEFYQNLFESDLIVCVRGGGNFSVRFYETLAMGRIPIFIDTDSPLPDISPLNWEDYIISCDSTDIDKLPQIAANWLKDKSLGDVFKKNRELWENHLSLDKFWINEFEKLRK